MPLAVVETTLYFQHRSMISKGNVDWCSDGWFAWSCKSFLLGWFEGAWSSRLVPLRADWAAGWERIVCLIEDIGIGDIASFSPRLEVVCKRA